MRYLEFKVFLFVLFVFLIVGVSATVAYNGPSPSDARKHAVESRADAFNKAVSHYPDPHPQNFPLRKALLEFAEREDLINHPWYVYLLGDNGNTTGYYVSKYPPENSCNFLSSTEDVYRSDQGNVKMQSPSYDGVYYGGSVCDEWFIFDYASNALIKFRGMHYYVSDKPLRLDVQPIKVKAQK